MMKHELDARIKPCESTPEEFEALERAYLASNTCDKDDVARAWKLLYKKDWERRQEIKFAPITEKEVASLYEDFLLGSHRDLVTHRGWVLKFEKTPMFYATGDVTIACHRIDDNFRQINWVHKWHCANRGRSIHQTY